jgi:NAD+ synthase
MNARVPAGLDARVLAIDGEAEAARIARWLAASTATLHKRGLVIAISGGVDSGVCAALAVRALGAARVHGLLLPERESSADSTARGREVAERLGIGFDLVDLSDALAALGCYRDRDAAIARLVPGYGPGWHSKIAIAAQGRGGLRFFRLVARAPDGALHTVRPPLREYLQIVAATNHKQRLRKAVEYHHADRLNYAVLGTPNRLEYDQGFFVKNGDGAADLKPIAHLYKTQVYALARHLGLPASVCDAQPTTDTYSLAQGQDEFFFALPYAQMDLALWAFEHGRPAAELAAALGLPGEQADAVYADIVAKRRAAQYLHAAPLTLLEASAR